MLNIKQRQTYLKTLGFYTGMVDGIEGKMTKQAYKSLQEKYFTRKSDVDGLYGKNTDILLVNAYRVKMYTRSFTLEEFKCGCKGKYCTGYPAILEINTLTLLQTIRNTYGATTVTSGLRCTTHNSKVGGIRGSRHTSGKAIDFVNGGATTNAKRINTVNWLIKQKGTRYVYCNGYAKTNYTTSHPKVLSMGNAIHFDIY